MSFQTKVRFAVFSDTHYDEKNPVVRQRFRRAMEAFYAYADAQPYSGLDAVYVVGDFTNLSTRSQMELFKIDCDAYIRRGTSLTVTMANHDLHYVEDYHAAMRDFREIFRLPFDRHAIFGGFHFISLSTRRDKGPWDDSFPPEKKEFLRTALEAARRDNPEKPIFLFQHPGLHGTVSGSWFGTTELGRELWNYPQIIDFSGHSHCAANSPLEIHQKYFTSLTTGGLQSVADELEGIVGSTGTATNGMLKRKMNYAQAVLAEVSEEGAVRIRYLDAVTGKFLPEERLVETCWQPETYQYTAARAKKAPTPYWPEGANARCVREGTALHIELTAARCEEDPVREYRLRAKDRDGHIVAQSAARSDYMTTARADVFQIVWEDVPQSAVTVEISAWGFWDNGSEAILKEEIQ